MAFLLYYCPTCKNMVAASLSNKCKTCGNPVNPKTMMDTKVWQRKSKVEQDDLLANPEKLLPMNPAEEKAKALSANVIAAKPLGITVSQEGNSGFYTNYVIYAFLLVFEDGHRELYQGKGDDPLIKNILDKIEV